MATITSCVLPHLPGTARLKAWMVISWDLDYSHELAQRILSANLHTDRDVRAVWFAMINIYYRCFAGGPRQVHIPYEAAFVGDDQREKHRRIWSIRTDMNHPGFGWMRAFPTVTVRQEEGGAKRIVGGPSMCGSAILHSAARDAPIIDELAPLAKAYVDSRLAEGYEALRPAIAAMSQEEIDKLDMMPPQNFPETP